MTKYIRRSNFWKKFRDNKCGRIFFLKNRIYKSKPVYMEYIFYLLIDKYTLKVMLLWRRKCLTYHKFFSSWGKKNISMPSRYLRNVPTYIYYVRNRNRIDPCNFTKFFNPTGNSLPLSIFHSQLVFVESARPKEPSTVPLDFLGLSGAWGPQCPSKAPCVKTYHILFSPSTYTSYIPWNLFIASDIPRNCNFWFIFTRYMCYFHYHFFA